VEIENPAELRAAPQTMRRVHDSRTCHQAIVEARSAYALAFGARSGMRTTKAQLISQTRRKNVG